MLGWDWLLIARAASRSRLSTRSCRSSFSLHELSCSIQFSTHTDVCNPRLGVAPTSGTSRRPRCQTPQKSSRRDCAGGSSCTPSSGARAAQVTQRTERCAPVERAHRELRCAALKVMRTARTAMRRESGAQRMLWFARRAAPRILYPTNSIPRAGTRSPTRAVNKQSARAVLSAWLALAGRPHARASGQASES